MSSTRMITTLPALILLGMLFTVAGCDDGASKQNAANNNNGNTQANNGQQNNNANNQRQKNPYSSAMEKSRDLKEHIESRSQDLADAIGEDGQFDLSKSGLPDYNNKNKDKSAVARDGATSDKVASDAEKSPTKSDADAKTSRNDASKRTDDKTKVPPLPAPKERTELFLDFSMTDQAGKPYNLKSMVGKPTAVTFVFTSCKNAQMCPMQAQKIGWLQDAASKQGIGDKINLLIITFDPDTDTPEKLRKFVGDNGVEFTNAKALRPKPSEFAEFLLEFGIRAGVAPNGEIDHQTDMMIFDAAGRRARWFGGMWDNDIALQDLQQLAAEDPAQPADKDAGEKNAGEEQGDKASEEQKVVEEKPGEEKKAGERQADENG